MLQKGSGKDACKYLNVSKGHLVKITKSNHNDIIDYFFHKRQASFDDFVLC